MTKASSVANKATCASISTVLSNCLLPTARVKLSAGKRVRKCMALLDSGSNCNLMSRKMDQKFKLRGSSHNLRVQRTGQIVEVRIRSHDE
jgi:hypothetical protein